MNQDNVRYNVVRIKASELYEQGVTVDEIAKRLDIPKMVAMAMIEKEGCKIDNG